MPWGRSSDGSQPGWNCDHEAFGGAIEAAGATPRFGQELALSRMTERGDPTAVALASADRLLVGLCVRAWRLLCRGERNLKELVDARNRVCLGVCALSPSALSSAPPESSRLSSFSSPIRNQAGGRRHALFFENAAKMQMCCLRSWQLAVASAQCEQARGEITELEGRFCMLQAEHTASMHEATRRQRAATELLDKHAHLAQNQATSQAEAMEAMRQKSLRLDNFIESYRNEFTLRAGWAWMAWESHVTVRKCRQRRCMLQSLLFEVQRAADRELMLVLVFRRWALLPKDARTLAVTEALNKRVEHLNGILEAHIYRYDSLYERSRMECEDMHGQLLRVEEHAFDSKRQAGTLDEREQFYEERLLILDLQGTLLEEELMEARTNAGTIQERANAVERELRLRLEESTENVRALERMNTLLAVHIKSSGDKVPDLAVAATCGDQDEPCSGSQSLNQYPLGSQQAEDNHHNPYNHGHQHTCHPDDGEHPGSYTVSDAERNSLKADSELLRNQKLVRHIGVQHEPVMHRTITSQLTQMVDVGCQCGGSESLINIDTNLRGEFSVECANWNSREVSVQVAGMANAVCQTDAVIRALMQSGGAMHGAHNCAEDAKSEDLEKTLGEKLVSDDGRVEPDALFELRQFVLRAKASVMSANAELEVQWMEARRRTVEVCDIFLDGHMQDEDSFLQRQVLWSLRRSAFKGHIRRWALRSLSRACEPTQLRLFGHWAERLRRKRCAVDIASRLNRELMRWVLLMWHVLAFTSWRQDVQELTLSFPDAPWPAPPPFKAELIKALAVLGATSMDDVRVSLQGGSVHATLVGPGEAINELRSLPLEALMVLGYKVAGGPTPSEDEARPAGCVFDGLGSKANVDSANDSPRMLPTSSRLLAGFGSHEQSEEPVWAEAVSAAPNTTPSQGQHRIEEQPALEAPPISSSAGVRRRLSQLQNLGSAHGQETHEKKLDRLVKERAAEVSGNISILFVSKDKYKIAGQVVSVSLKANDQVMARKGPSWIPLPIFLQQLAVGLPPDKSASGSTATVEPLAAAKAASKAGVPRAVQFATTAAPRTASAGPPKAKPKAKVAVTGRNQSPNRRG